jgi:NADPH:quinone reductase-like Zn-dependent oxidoreductase
MAGGDMKQIMDAVTKGRFYSKKGSKTLAALSHHPRQSELITLTELIEAGKVKPVIDTVFPFEQVPEAITYYGKGKSRGKVVIEVRKES